MSTVCSLDPRARERTLLELTRLATELQRSFRIDAIYVFGSFARSDEHEGSDIDLLVVGELPGRAFDRVGEVIRRTRLPVEPVVLLPATFARRRRDGHPLIASAIHEGMRLV